MLTVHYTNIFRRLSFAATLLLQLTACIPQLVREPVSPRLPIVPARNLLLDTHPFPSGWITGSCEPNCSRHEGDTHAERSFYIVNVPGHVLQDVFRLSSSEAAQAKFQRYREVDFRVRRPPNRQYLPPPEVAYRSPIADDYYLGCGVDEVPACEVIARYDIYFVYLYFSIDDGRGGGIKLTAIEPILRAMDQQVRTQLYPVPPKKAPTAE